MGQMQEEMTSEYEKYLQTIFSKLAEAIKDTSSNAKTTALYLYENKGKEGQTKGDVYKQGSVSVSDMIKQDRDVDVTSISTKDYALLKKYFDKSGVPYNLTPVLTQSGDKAFRLTFPTRFSKIVSNTLSDFAKASMITKQRPQQRSIISSIKEKASEVSRSTRDAFRDKVSDISR